MQPSLSRSSASRRRRRPTSASPLLLLALSSPPLASPFLASLCRRAQTLTRRSRNSNHWDFLSLTPESVFMSLYQLSDHTIPRSYRMIQGYGVNTFVLVNKEGTRTFVKYVALSPCRRRRRRRGGPS